MKNALRSALGVTIVLIGFTVNARADVFTFAPGQYDNTANTMAPPVNNQTTGSFRDVFWWGNAYGGGTPGNGSPDFINSGNSLIFQNNHAVPGSGPYSALNFTGAKIPNGGQTFLTVYDTTPGDGTATKDVFNGNGLEISADVLFANPGHQSFGGVVSLYNEGQDGLALVAFQGGGNNPDIPSLRLVSQSAGSGMVLASTSLGGTTFDAAEWFRVTMSLLVNGDSFTVTGTIQNHTNPADPTSGLVLGPIVTLSFTGSPSNPGNTLDLTNPGEIGLMAGTKVGYGDAAVNGNGANPGVDNLGVSITNFQTPSSVPEPSSLLLLVPIAAWAGTTLRRRNAKRQHSAL